MLLHFSRTVLAAIVWTILLYGSAEETNSKQTRVLRFRNNSTKEYQPESIDRNWNRENRSEPIGNDESNGETKSPSDGDIFITKDDMVEDSVAIVVEKCHVLELPLSRETASDRISTENETNNTYPETRKYRGSDNDDDGVFQHYPKASFDLNSWTGNIDVARDADNGMRSSEKRGSNVSRDVHTNDTRTEGNDVESNKSSFKDTVYKEEASNLTEIMVDTVSTIINSNPSGVNSQSRNSHLENFTIENYNSTSGSVAENENASQGSEFLGYTSFNDILSEKYHRFGEAMKSSKDERTAKHEDVLSQESRDTLFFLDTSVETENIGKGENARRKTFAGYTRSSSAQIPITGENDYYRNTENAMGEKSIGSRPSRANEIYGYKMNEKPGFSRAVQDDSIANDIVTTNEQAIKNIDITKQPITESQDSYGVFGFFGISTNLLKKKGNPITSVSSTDNVHPSLFTFGEISPKLETENLKNIHKSPETDYQGAKMSSLKGNLNKGYKQTLMRNSLGWQWDPRALNESKHSKKQHSASLESTKSYKQDEQKQKPGKFDYRGNMKDGQTSVSSLLLNDKLSERNSRTAIISGRNRALIKDISLQQRYDHSENHPQFEPLTTRTYDNRISPRNRKYIDLSTSPHIKPGIYENVVKTEMTALQRDREARKTFIGRKSSSDINLRSYKKRGMQVRMQERKKYVEKPAAGRKHMETDEFHEQKKKEASWLEPLVNSKTSSSLQIVEKRTNNLFDSIMSPATDDTRKMESSGTDESSWNSRKMKIVMDDRRRNRVIFSTKSTNVVPSSAQFLRVTATKKNAIGDDSSVTLDKRDDSIETILQPTRINTSSAMGSSVVQVHPRNFVIDGLDEDHHVRNDVNSLEYRAVESNVAGFSKPVKTQWKNPRTTLHGQDSIINKSAENNIILSEELTSTWRPGLMKVEESSGSKDRHISSEKILVQASKRSLLASPEIKTRGLSSTTAKSANNETNMVTQLFLETLTSGKRNEVSNNASKISGDQENTRLNLTSLGESVTGSDASWKLLVNDDATAMSLRKIDSSVGPTDQTSHRVASRRTEDFVENSPPDSWYSGLSRVGAKFLNARTKQAKRGFTTDDIKSNSTAKAMIRRLSDHETFANAAKRKDRNAKTPDVIDDDSRTFDSSSSENAKLSKNDEFLSNRIQSIATAHSSTSNLSSKDVRSYNSMDFDPMSGLSRNNTSPTEKDALFATHQQLRDKIVSSKSTDPTNGNSSITDIGNHDSLFGSPIFKRNYNSSNASSPESESLNLPLQKHITADTIKGTQNTRTLNQTTYDNSTRITAALNQWPVKRSAVVEGDLVLGGLMMVHEREDSVTCGPVMPQGGVQALEAMLYTLDWLNERDLVPGVNIGAHILDDCDKDTYGLEMAVDFIKGSISNIDGAEYHCNKTAVRKVISGVVGAASSVTSIQVANLLRLFRIPQVSFFSTSPELSNKMRFEYFTRTIPSDHYQVKAMVDIVLKMGWSYISIIYEESNYGEKAYEELEKLLGKHQICIAVKEKLSKDSGVAEAHVYDNIVQKLLTKPRARGCIIFASDQEVAGVMRAVRRCNATGAFSWIGSDGWSARSLVSDGNEREMEGTLSVQPQANPVKGFEDYFLNLTVENNRRNPWFVEFWEDHFKCRYPNSSKTPYNNYTDECTTNERLTKENTAFEDQLQFVSDAVLAFAYAFRNMHSHLCHGKPGLCDAMKPTKGTELLNYLRNVKFDGLSGDVFHFDKNGDGPARYNIIHFKQISPGEYKWIRVGKYLEGELRLNMSEIQFRLGHPEAPESVCSLPCEVGQAKKYVEGESCCWHCFNCSQDEIRHISDEKQCVSCPKGTLPDEAHSYCRDIPEEFLRPESGWAIGAMSFSSTGILITLFVGGVFLKHNDTPIVRASGRELSYVLLTGILLCYLVTFALVLRPTDLVCSIQRFSAGFCFTVMYAALLTKTNRISRIFNAGKRSAKRPSFISPRSQLIICSMLVAVQILIHAVWMLIDPAKARHHYPTREDNLLVCNSYIDASYMIAFTYPIILIVVCTVYAVLTRKIPEAFNESKHIGFTMYTTCVIWLAFVPLYFATGSHVALRITSMSVTISLSATVTIACLFTPKLYIILIHPERNVRPNMMHHRYNTTKGSVITTANASSMMAPVTLTAVTCDQNKAVKKHVITTMDCSTQSEHLELEMNERKNGQLPASFATRSTQTLLNNNGKESSSFILPIKKDIDTEENICSTNVTGKISNGPFAQNEVPL